MKNFFQVNVKTNEKDYAPYIVRSISAKSAQMQEMAENDVADTKKASQLPKWAKITMMVCLLGFASLFLGILKAFADRPDDVSVGEMWAVFTTRGGIIMIVICAVCFAVMIGLFVWSRMRYKQVTTSLQYQSVFDECEKLQNEGYLELGVPSDADTIDIFGFAFKYNRKCKAVQANVFAKYISISVKIFANDDALYFADTSDLIKIPRSAVMGVTPINKTLSFVGWNKTQSYKSKLYKPYKIRANNYGTLFIKGCYSVGLLLGGEETEIVIPPYENEILAKYFPVNIR